MAELPPLNDGHVLVIPKAHAETLFDIAEDDLVAVARLARLSLLSENVRLTAP